ncbi:MAG: hypothetical protein EHM34_07105 [Nitrosopumilales archaeon]|nr:MAG: hypothetical protein EHM34_07105 [Nitrosopumilales archaeon]
MSISVLPWLLIAWLIWGPVIINSQPGTSFYVFGIDWKADNLDNTMFWVGIILVLAGAFGETYSEKKKEKKDEEEKRRYV